MLEKMKNQIENSYYWDAKVKKLECNYFGDEVILTFEDDKEDITYYFEECYTIKIKHIVEYLKNKPYKELNSAQIPYFMQDVDLNEIIISGKKFLEFKINMFPIKLYIVCNNFHII